jgi:hypothetical protein
MSSGDQRENTEQNTTMFDPPTLYTLAPIERNPYLYPRGSVLYPEGQATPQAMVVQGIRAHELRYARGGVVRRRSMQWRGKGLTNIYGMFANVQCQSRTQHLGAKRAAVRHEALLPYIDRCLA